MNNIDNKGFRCLEVGGITFIVRLRVASESCVFLHTTKTLKQTWDAGLFEQVAPNKAMVVLIRIARRKIKAKQKGRVRNRQGLWRTFLARTQELLGFT